tara:strand:+ start:873 stop:1124 length:252 start_codon:yes stop_codon:yes gene_type:complete
MKLLLVLLTFYIFPVHSGYLEQLEDECIADFIDDSSNRRLFVEARGIERTCACIVNNNSQGLSENSCPDFKTVTESQIKEFFR